MRILLSILIDFGNFCHTAWESSHISNISVCMPKIRVFCFQLGLMEIPSRLPAMDDMLDDDDADLEAELDALIGGGNRVIPKKSPAKRQQLGLTDIKKMADACMKDGISDVDEDDENDAELLVRLLI